MLDCSKTGILRILIQRDGMSKEDALAIIKEAEEYFWYHLERGEEDYAMEVCEVFFGLEPDFLEAFMMY